MTTPVDKVMLACVSATISADSSGTERSRPRTYDRVIALCRRSGAKTPT